MTGGWEIVAADAKDEEPGSRQASVIHAAEHPTLVRGVWTQSDGTAAEASVSTGAEGPGLPRGDKRSYLTRVLGSTWQSTHPLSQCCTDGQRAIDLARTFIGVRQYILIDVVSTAEPLKSGIYVALTTGLGIFLVIVAAFIS